MKKFFIMAVMLFTVAFGANAETNNDTNVTSVEAYTFNINYRSLARCLDLSIDQVEPMKEIHNTFSKSMLIAAHMDKESQRKFIDNVINYDLRQVSYVLNEKQYRKYVTILNVTMRNRGLA